MTSKPMVRITNQYEEVKHATLGEFIDSNIWTVDELQDGLNRLFNRHTWVIGGGAASQFDVDLYWV